MFRLDPVAPAAAYQTFQVAAPLSTHWRPGTCAEAGCTAHLHGWQTSVDETTDLGQRQAHYIRHDTTRRHTERRADTGLTVFAFEPGQTCFGGQHRIRLDREERFLIRGGDWRGNPRGDRRETTAAGWVDDFGEHQETLADQFGKG
jgi:hypothetical protein